MRGGPGPGRRSRILNTFNEILVFDLSLATGLYALTIYAGIVMGTRRRGINRSLRDVSDSAARTGLERKPPLVLRGLVLLPAAFTTCSCAKGDGPRPLCA